MSDIVTRLRTNRETYAPCLFDDAAAEIERLRAARTHQEYGIAYPEQHIQELVQTINTLRAERDALFVLTDRLTAEHDALRAERDEVRQSYCSLMEAYRGGDGRVTANKLGWGYLFPRRPKKEDGK